jgi:hypothetical protein
MILLARGLIKSVFKTYIFLQIVIFFNGNKQNENEKKKKKKDAGGPSIRWVDDQVGFASGLELNWLLQWSREHGTSQ